MKIQSINCYNTKYVQRFIAGAKNIAEFSKYKENGRNYSADPEGQKAYLLNSYRQNILNFGNLRRYRRCSKNEFFKNFNPVEDYEFTEEFKNYVFSPKRVTKEDFEKLSKSKQNDFSMLSYEFFQEETEKTDIMNPETIINYSNDLKEFFDKKYGKDKYRIIAPGTSPSNIAQGMEYLGCEVIFLPFSDIRVKFHSCAYGIKDIPYSYKNYKNSKIAMHYLNYKGVGQNNDKKTNIILDYAVTGNSIYCVAKFLNEFLKEKHPFRKPKIKTCSLIDTIQQAESKKSFTDNVEVQSNINSFEYLCGSSRIEATSPVPHFSITGNNNKEGYINSSNKTKKEIFDEFDNYSTPLSKIYSICLLEEARNLSK